MIELTRLNGNKFAVNCDLIKYVEASPDTILTLITGEKLLVTESRDTVEDLTMQYRAQVFRSAWPDALASLAARTAYDVSSAAQQKDGIAQFSGS